MDIQSLAYSIMEVHHTITTQTSFKHCSIYFKKKNLRQGMPSNSLRAMMNPLLRFPNAWIALNTRKQLCQRTRNILQSSRPKSFQHLQDVAR